MRTAESITGGFVYRGSALGGALHRTLFLRRHQHESRVVARACRSIGSGEATKTDLAEHTAELGNGANSVSSFGVDANGELYLVSYGTGRDLRDRFGRLGSAAAAATTLLVVHDDPAWT